MYRCLLPLLIVLLLAPCAARPALVGTVWQPDAATVRPTGNWQQLGARQLLVQWSLVDDHDFIGACGAPAAMTPDWQRIAAEPWAQEIILGLAGRFDERQARGQLDALLQQSRCIAALPLPFRVAGWYFPVEIDPTWQDAPRLAAILEQLPRPLWVSVYDNSNIGGPALADWLASWLPADVGIFFQDGVGVHARSAPVAADYMQALQQRLGRQRVRLIAEAFRPAAEAGGGFRAATPAELATQLSAYQTYPSYLFEGPRYVPQETIDGLQKLIPISQFGN